MLKSAFTFLAYALLPLLVLFSLVLVACVLSYGLVMIAGEVLPLPKMIAKITQLLLVLSIFPLRRFLNISWAEMGFAPKAIFFKQMLLGVALGALTLLPVLGTLSLLEVNIFDASKEWTLGLLLKKFSVSLLLALLISVLEEPLFRGLLLTGLHKKMQLWAAIGFSSSYYAALHFLKATTPIPTQAIHFNSGFVLFSEAIAGWFNPVMFPAFVGLLMVGIFLSVIRSQIQHSLGLCIGFHASWVWQIKLNKEIFNTDYASPYAYLVSHYDGLVGYLIAGWLLLATLIYLSYQYLKNRKF